MRKHTKILKTAIVLVLVVAMLGSVVPTMVYATDNANDHQSIQEHLSFVESAILTLRSFIQRILDFFKDLFKGGDETDDELPAVKYEYYNHLNDAVNDVNLGTVGSNSDTTAENASVAVYNDENGLINVIFLKDITANETIVISADMIINLNGYTFSTVGITAIEIMSGNVVMVGSKEGSSIEVIDSASARAIIQQDGNLKLIGGTYTVFDCAGTTSCIRVLGGNSLVDAADITAFGSGGTVRGLEVSVNACVEINNSNINVRCTDNNAQGLYIAGNGIINNSKLVVTAELKSRALNVAVTGVVTATETEFIGYTTALVKSVSNSQGILNSGTLTINNCYAYGNHSAISNAGELYVYGGTYEGPGHGGIYFGNINAPAYVHDATLRYCDQKEGLDASKADFNDAGFYIGGGSDRNNVVVYMDNCDIGGDVWALILRGSSNEHNNTLYISNSRLTGKGYVRVDNNTHRLFIGAGNNFTEELVADLNKQPLAEGTIIVTDNTYRY